MPRFVILRHELPDLADRASHWDLMLEEDEHLVTWSLPSLPCQGQYTWANQLADHRLHYLDYEGPVSGDRGTVKRYDQGMFEWIARTPLIWRVRLCGEQIAGILELTRDAPADQRWRIWFSSGRDATGVDKG